MSQPLKTNSPLKSGANRRRGLSLLLHGLKLVFLKGPKVLFTSQISGLCGALMILSCVPSLLYCAMLTIPGLVFNSPDQQAYYYFSRVLNSDPGHWAVLAVTGVCTLIALALPATMPPKPMPLR